MVNLEAALGLTYWIVSIVNEIANVEILNSWTANNELCFDGIIKTKCADKITDGWEMYLNSIQSLSTLTSSHADIRKNNANSTSFILTSLPWNSQFLAGEIIQVSFAGCTPQKDTEPQITVEFYRNGTMCPQITPPADRQSIKVSTILTHDDHSTFQASLSITLPVTVQGDWLIYFAVSTHLSQLNAAGVLSTPGQGDVFTLTNLNWQNMFMAGFTYVLEVEGTKATQETKEPCVIAIFSWDKDMEIHPSTTIKPTWSTTEIVQQTVPLTTRSIAPTSTATTLPPSCAPYNYDEVLHKSILFYEAQRSGQLPENNRIPWRGDSALGDKGDNGEDLTGGWYDAGDYVKFGFPMAFSTTLLTWGLIEFPQGYTTSGEIENMFNSIKWPLDYFIKAHVNPNEFYGQVGDGDIDHAYWGRPEDMTISRPAFKIDSEKPGSDLAAETAAAMAAGSIAFAERDPDYAQSLLDHAKTLYDLADNYRGKYSDSITDAEEFYSSSGYGDELAWGAAWLYRATNDESYLTKAENHFTNFNIDNPAWAFSWDEKVAGVQMLLFQLTGKDAYKTAIQRSLDEWLPGGSVEYTPKGLAWRIQWGSNRYAANTAFLALLAATKGLKTTEYREFGEKQIHYMLGDSGRSFVVGFGHNPPTRPHHASSSCPDKPAGCDWDDFSRDAPNPQVLHGALVGGPDRNDGYEDKRDDYVKNEVTCDYNAGFQSAVAALKADVASCSRVGATSSTWRLYSSPTVGSTSTSPAVSSITERLESTTSLETSYFKVDKTSTISIQSSPTIVVQPTSSITTTGVGETTLPHECGDVTVPSGYYYLETSVNELTDWPQGFTGQIIFTTTVKVRDGWQVELVMDNAISLLNVHIVTTTPSSGSRFTLRNKDYNIQLEQGSTITIDFEATKATENDNVPCMRAVFMWAVEEECPTLDSAGGSNSIDATVKITSQWNEGISGEITVMVPVQIENGWQMQVLFDIPLTLTVYVAISSPATGTQFTLTNESYNRQLPIGSTLVVAFTATKQEIGATVLCTDALFLW